MARVALRGELDLLTVSKLAEVIDGLEPRADGVCHLVLDLCGPMFMDPNWLHELIKQDDYARSSRHNLAVVRGTDAIAYSGAGRLTTYLARIAPRRGR